MGKCALTCKNRLGSDRHLKTSDMVRVGQVCMRSWISRMDHGMDPFPFSVRVRSRWACRWGCLSEREASRLPFSITLISSPAARELRLHELRLLAMRSLHDAEERGRMPPPCTYGMRSAASLSRGELQREVAGLCRTCERRRARMGSRETLRAPPARVGHAHTHTAPGYVTCTCSPKVIAGGSSQRTR